LRRPPASRAERSIRNFDSKDELIIGMLEDHVEQSIRRNLDLLTRHKDLADYIEALRNMDRSRQDPLARSPLLHNGNDPVRGTAEKRRPELAKRLRARRSWSPTSSRPRCRTAARTDP